MSLAFGQFVLYDPPYGWTETYYCDVTNLSEVVLPLQTLWAKRATLLGSSPRLTSVRYGFGSGTRQVFAIAGDAPGFPTRQTGWPSSAETDTAIKFRMETSPGSRRILLMRGLPEAVIVQPNAWEGTAIDSRGSSFNDLLANFGATLTGGFWCIKVRDYALPLGRAGTQPYQSLYPLLTINTVGNSNRKIVVAMDATDFPIKKQTAPNVFNPVEVGDRVVIRGAQGGIHINGVWLINSISVSSFQYIFGPHRRPVAPPPNSADASDGFAYYLHYSPVVITGAAAESNILVNRKSGRPLGQPAGRRLVR